VDLVPSVIHVSSAMLLFSLFLLILLFDDAKFKINMCIRILITEK